MWLRIIDFKCVYDTKSKSGGFTLITNSDDGTEWLLRADSPAEFTALLAILKEPDIYWDPNNNLISARIKATD